MPECILILGASARAAAFSTRRAGWAAVAGLGEQHLPALSDQGFLLRKTEAFGKHALAIVGGSSVATLWGVYELVERYGVRYLVDGDVYPQSAGPFHLPDLDRWEGLGSGCL
mgnify:CR=1 FL=1